MVFGGLKLEVSIATTIAKATHVIDRGHHLRKNKIKIFAPMPPRGNRICSPHLGFVASYVLRSRLGQV
jgi:hypothetical protein